MLSRRMHIRDGLIFIECEAGFVDVTVVAFEAVFLEKWDDVAFVGDGLNVWFRRAAKRSDCNCHREGDSPSPAS